MQEAAASVTADLGVGEGLSSVALVARTKEAAASQASQMAAATTWGELRADQARQASPTCAPTRPPTGPPTSPPRPTLVRDERRDELITIEGTAAGRTVDSVVDGRRGGQPHRAGWT